MFKRIGIGLLTLTLGLTLTACNASEKEVAIEEENKETEKIRDTVLDYIEGWYEGDDERMKRALHPDLVKRSIEGDSIHNLDYDTMIASTKRGGGKNIPKDTYEIKVKILDINNNIATAMTESQYIDYIHLAKIDDNWVIINVLWDFK